MFLLGAGGKLFTHTSAVASVGTASKEATCPPTSNPPPSPPPSRGKGLVQVCGMYGFHNEDILSLPSVSAHETNFWSRR